MLLLGALTAGKSRRSFVYTGLFAIAYGTRLAFNTGAFTLLYGHPRWLDYVRSAFEYLVPIPAALLFGSFSEHRWRLGHRDDHRALSRAPPSPFRTRSRRIRRLR